MKQHLISTLLAALLAVSAMGRGRPVRQLGMPEGLSCEFVLGMALDKKGFLWVATEEGLNRFDGSRFFSYYKCHGEKGLTGNELNALLDDPHEQKMWIATQRAGLNVYDYARDSFACYRHDKHDKGSIATDDITSVAAAEDGSIWVTTYWEGVEYLDKKHRKFIHYNTRNVRGMVSNQVWCVLDAGGGIIYAGHVRGGFSVIDTRNRTARHYRHGTAPLSLSDDDVHCIFRDRRGRVWVGTNRGLDLFDPIRGTFTPYPDDGRLRQAIYGITQPADGTLWIATERNGVAIMEERQPVQGGLPAFAVRYIEEGDDPANLCGSSVRSIVEDRFGNMWIGIYGAGVNFLGKRMPLFSQITYRQGQRHTAGGTERQPRKRSALSTRAALGMDTDPAGRLWVGTDGDGINVFDGSLRRTDTAPILPGRYVQAVCCDPRGNVWMGCFNDNLYYLPAGGKTPRAVLPGIEDVRCLFRTADGTLWAGTNNGLYEIDMATVSVRRRVATRHLLVRSMTRDRHGRHWVGTFGGGILIYDRSFRFLKQLTTADGMPSNTVNAVVCDRNGRVWLGTGEGLVCFESGDLSRFRTYGRRQGAANANIRMMGRDRQGNLWFSTSKGIGCKPAHDTAIVSYDYRDGVSHGNFIAGSMAVGRDGTLFFGGTRGITYFRPEQLHHRQESTKVYITSLGIMGEHEGQPDSTVVLIGRDRVRLTYRQNTFSVCFNVLDYAVADGVEYACRIRGLQDEWSITPGNTITLRNIPYGHYRLEVRSRLHNRQWNTAVAGIDITVTPPWWLTGWAWLAYTMLAALAIFRTLRFYRHKLKLEYLLKNETDRHEQEKRLNEERMQLFTNITHELRTPLTLIMGPLEDMSHSSDIPEKQKHRLAVVHRSAVRLKELIDRIMEFRKTESHNRSLTVVRDNLVDAVHEVCLKYEELGHNDHLDIRFLASEPVIEAWFDPEVIRIIVDNLVSNAMKYTERGTIDISVERRRGVKPMVEIAVSDTGSGIAPDALTRVFEHYYQEKSPRQASGTGIGLALVKNLVTLHEGTVRAESRVGQGSTFVVTLEEHNIYPQAARGTGTATPRDPRPEEASPADPATSADIMLVIEDNKDIRQYIAECFAGEFEVIQAEDGRQGLAAALETIPDIIISDVMMPHMDGNTLCKALKQDIRTSHVPVILLTAKDSNTAKEEGYDAGADSYLTKPFSRSLLESRVKNLLLSRRRLLQHGSRNPAPGQERRQKQEVLQEAATQMDREFFERLHKTLDEHISGELDMSCLTREMGVSASTLYRKMKALTGMNTNEYVRHYKMLHAERLLLQDKYTISEIAFMVGFNSTAYFRKCFKDEFGSIPSEYVKQLRSETAAGQEAGA